MTMEAGSGAEGLVGVVNPLLTGGVPGEIRGARKYFDSSSPVRARSFRLLPSCVCTTPLCS